MAVFKNKIVQILIFALTPLIIAFFVGYTSMGHQYPWYDTIKRPSYNPPAWVNFKKTLCWDYIQLILDFRSYVVSLVLDDGLCVIQSLGWRRWFCRKSSACFNNLHYSPRHKLHLDACILLFSRNRTSTHPYFDLVAHDHRYWRFVL